MTMCIDNDHVTKILFSIRRTYFEDKNIEQGMSNRFESLPLCKQ